jgi:hypothetical protein
MNLPYGLLRFVAFTQEYKLNTAREKFHFNKAHLLFLFWIEGFL